MKKIESEKAETRDGIRLSMGKEAGLSYERLN